MDSIKQLIAGHAGQSGAYVLEAGEEALIARAWLADHAEHTIEVQYFIWSTDNVGILAAESVLRAAERGVRVRIIVDDLLIDAPDESLLALTLHPNIEIRVYNPNTSVGVPLHTRLLNVFTDFRGVNQRMHDKTFIVDGRVAITGGRNMSAEYYDYSHKYNFRDRDVLLMGDVVAEMQSSFERFWLAPLSVQVEELYDGVGIFRKNVKVADAEIQQVYRELHRYAGLAENFAPQVRSAIDAAPTKFAELAGKVSWGRVAFISDMPGKNDTRSFTGGGLATAALAKLIDEARSRIVIQSPYLVFSDEALALFRAAKARGVRVRINTNSLASTDNLQAFGGYRNQRAELIESGFEIFEYRPDALSQRLAMQKAVVGTLNARSAPLFGLHSKSLVVDGQVAFIGTYNLDPRSENLNTEVGAVIYDSNVAAAVEAAIEVDMQPTNSWNAAQDDPEQYAGFAKRGKARFWQMMPIKPLL
jgi:putative cardiolipin synthase